MSEAVDQQHPPIANGQKACWDEVIEDIQARDQFGLAKYKTRLQPFNGRDVLTDIYQELLDAVVYVKQMQMERRKTIAMLNEVVESPLASEAFKVILRRAIQILQGNTQ